MCFANIAVVFSYLNWLSVLILSMRSNLFPKENQHATTNSQIGILQLFENSFRVVMWHWFLKFFLLSHRTCPSKEIIQTCEQSKYSTKELPLDKGRNNSLEPHSIVLSNASMKPQRLLQTPLKTNEEKFPSFQVRLSMCQISPIFLNCEN